MGFFAVYDRIVPAQNKYVATLFNGAVGRKIVIERILRCNWQLAAVTGVLIEHEIRYITARIAGTNVSINPEDSDQPQITVGITADTGSTGVTEIGGLLLKRFFAVTEELTAATLAGLDNVDHQTVWWRRPGSSGIVARPGQGITIKCVTNSNVGTVSYIFEFRDDPG